MNYIYIVRTIDLKQKTEQDLRNEFEICRINHPLWKTKTYKDYIKFLKGWKKDKYSISYEDNAYCESWEIAYEKITTNACDMNDGGVFNYASIIKTPINCCYPTSCIIDNNISLFKFNRDTDDYFKIDENFNEETKWMIDAVRGIISG